MVFLFLKIFPQHFVTRVLCQTTIKRGFRISKVDDVEMNRPAHLNAYERGSVRCILVSDKNGNKSSVFVLSSKVKQLKESSILRGGFTFPQTVLMVPGKHNMI